MLGDGDTPTVALTESHRCAPAVARAVTASPAGCPAPTMPGRSTAPADGRVAGGADRRAAARRGGPDRRRACAGRTWSTACRGRRWRSSCGRCRGRAPRLAARWPRRACRSSSRRPTGPLAEQPAVAALLTVLDATGGRARRRAGAGLADRADRPGRSGVAAPAAADPAPRRRRPAHRGSSRDLLVEALDADRRSTCRRPLARALRRVRAVVDAAARRSRPAQDPRFTLWQAWHQSGPAAALAGGERAGGPGRRPGRPRPRRGHGVVRRGRAVRRRTRRARRCAGSSITSGRWGCPAAPRRPATSGDAVAVLSARTPRSAGNGTSSSSPGCRKGCGPTRFPAAACSPRSSSSTYMDGVDRRARRRGRPLLAEERRLLIAAIGRARDAGSGDGGRRRQRRRRRCCRRRSAPSSPRWPPSDRADVPPSRSGAAGAGSGGGGRPAARAWCARRDGAVDDDGADLRGNAIGPAGHSGRGRCRPGRWHGMTALSHRRAAVDGRRPRRHAVAVDAADADRLPVALAARTPRRQRRP